MKVKVKVSKDLVAKLFYLVGTSDSVKLIAGDETVKAVQQVNDLIEKYDADIEFSNDDMLDINDIVGTQFQK